MQLSSKIKAAREIKGFTQVQLSQYSGVSLDSIKRYETKDSSNITIDNLKKIANALDFELYYFLSEEDVSNLSPSQENDSSMIQSDKIDSSMLSLNQKNTPQSTLDKDFVQIPVFDNVYASAGAVLINDEHIESYVGIDKSFLLRSFGLTSFVDLSIISVRGDSMAPTMPENCQLLVQKGVPREGQICVTRIDDELYIKRLQKRPKYKLISDNKSYDDIILEGKNYEILGVVVGLFQKMT